MSALALCRAGLLFDAVFGTTIVRAIPLTRARLDAIWLQYLLSGWAVATNVHWVPIAARPREVPGEVAREGALLRARGRLSKKARRVFAWMIATPTLRAHRTSALAPV